MKQSIAISLISMIFFMGIYGQSINISKLDDFINPLAARGLAMGSLTISKNGTIQYQRAIGYTYIDTDKKTPSDIHTKYRIGSVSKMFTAVMIFQLVEEGKIDLDQKLHTYYPNLPNAGKITLRHLLYHRSGLHDYTKDTDFTAWMDKPQTHEDLLKVIADKGADFEPDARADYSNTNYLILSYIIEHICGVSYGDALQKRIASKIGLHDTHHGNSINIERNESSSYKYVDGGWRKEQETHPSIHGGAGMIVSTPTDMVKFIEALFAHELVGKSSVDNMKTLVDDYGIGMFSNAYGSKPSFGHNGRIEEFYSALWHFPGEKLSLAYCANGVVFPRKDFIEGVLKICFGERFDMPFSTSIELTSTDIDKYLGKYSSPQLPSMVTCAKRTATLLLETNENAFEVEPVGKNYFMNLSKGYFFEFMLKKVSLK